MREYNSDAICPTHGKIELSELQYVREAQDFRAVYPKCDHELQLTIKYQNFSQWLVKMIGCVFLTVFMLSGAAGVIVAVCLPFIFLFRL